MSRDRSFWDPLPLAPIPILAALRDVVLARSRTRLPKWKFRISALAIQLQPQPTYRCSAYELARGAVQRVLDFDGRVWAGTLSLEVLRRTPPDIQFGVYATTDEAWVFQAYKAFDASFVIRDQLVAALTPTAFASLPAVLFSPQCLVCGRTLRDPASMARYIGPECANSDSLEVPGIRTLQNF